MKYKKKEKRKKICQIFFSRTNCYMGMEEFTDFKRTLHNYAELLYRKKKRNATFSGKKAN